MKTISILIMMNHGGIYSSPFKEGFLLIKRNGLYGLVNDEKNKILEPIAKNLIIFHFGYAPIQIKKGKWGIIDINLNWVVEPTLLEMKFCFESYNDVEDYITSIGLPFIAKSSKTKKYGLISYDGIWLCEPIYDKINANDYYFSPHKYLFYLKFKQDRYKGIINLQGKEVFKDKISLQGKENYNAFDFNDFRFDISVNYKNSKIPKKNIYFLVKKNKKIGYFTTNGKFNFGNPNELN